MTDAPPASLYQPQMLRLLQMKEERLKACEVCKGRGWKSDTEMCDCLAGVMFEYRLSCSNIPAKYRNVSFDNFVRKEHVSYKEAVRYSQNLRGARAEGIGAHIHSSKSGTGKTLLVSCILLSALREGYWVWWTSMAQLLEDIRRGYDDPAKRDIVEWAMFKTDFILLDELTKTHDKNGWVEDRTNDLIQRRVNDNRPILSTDNDPISKLTLKYKDHVISRFVGQQLEISVDVGLDYRVHHQKKQLKERLYGG